MIMPSRADRIVRACSSTSASVIGLRSVALRSTDIALTIQTAFYGGEYSKLMAEYAVTVLWPGIAART